MLATIESLRIVRMPIFRDLRGALIPIEMVQSIPFPVVRVFFVSDVPDGASRGAHAHKVCHQFLVSIAGEIIVSASDGVGERSFTLNAGDGLHIPPLIFASERYRNVGSVIAVFCDQPFDAEDYIDD